MKMTQAGIQEYIEMLSDAPWRIGTATSAVKENWLYEMPSEKK